MNPELPPAESMPTGLKIGIRALLFAAAILLLLLILTGILTRSIPSGSFDRTSAGGSDTVIVESFSWTDNAPLPAWRWFTAPFEVLAGPDAVMLISIIFFMILIAGAISVMQSGGILMFLISSIIAAFQNRKYQMQAVVILVFMLFGSILGSMEEVVVLVPIISALAVRMGWDKPTGLGLSLGAIGFGFAAAVTNPFTIGVAQRLAGLPVFSGAGYRMIIFVLVYTLYTLYVARISHGREKQLKTEKGNQLEQGQLSGKSVRTGMEPAFAGSPDNEEIPAYSSSRRMKRSLSWFSLSMAAMILLIISSSFIGFLSDIMLVLVTLCFLAGGLGAGFISGMKIREVGKSFISGVLGVAPGIILVLMAAGIKHILTESEVMDTILYWASSKISQTGPYSAVLMVYALVLVLNFFISSGSAKAFLIIPIISPLADIVGLSRQSAVLAYMFGDGFSNIIYPTNALLLICLAVTGISYGKWFRWIWKIEAVLFGVSVLLLLLAVRIGY